MKPENVLLCIEDRQVRLLAKQAIEWERMGENPDESAVGVDDLNIRERPKQYQEKSASTAVVIGAGAVYDAEKKKLTQNQKKKLKKKQKKLAQREAPPGDKQQHGEQDEDDEESAAADEDENSIESADSIERLKSEGMKKLLKLIDDDDDDNDNIDGEDKSTCNSTTSNGQQRSACKKSAYEQLEEIKNKQFDSIFKVVDKKHLQVSHF